MNHTNKEDGHPIFAWGEEFAEAHIKKSKEE